MISNPLSNSKNKVPYQAGIRSKDPNSYRTMVAAQSKPSQVLGNNGYVIFRNIKVIHIWIQKRNQLNAAHSITPSDVKSPLVN